MIDVRPISLAVANAVVSAWHSHHKPVRGHKFSLCAEVQEHAEDPVRMVGVVIEGRPWTSGNKGDRWLPGLYAPTTEVVDRVRWEVAA